MDLIDRASVLKAIDEYERLSAVSQTVRNMTSLREIVQWLPAVQPEPKPDENGSEPFGNAEMLSDRTTDDCISRQAAIDALESIGSLDTEADKKYARSVFEALPAAQPDVVRCGQCKYAEVADKEDAQDGYTCQFHRGSVWFSGSYCSWAERRTDE